MLQLRKILLTEQTVRMVPLAQLELPVNKARKVFRALLAQLAQLVHRDHKVFKVPLELR